jgi:putative ABC transport system ATP-binding protein
MTATRTTGSPAGVAIRCEGVVHIYPGNGKDIDDVVALRGVDLEADPGEFIALLGPSGSGKSTVLGLLAGVLRPSAGRVLIGEHDIGRMPARDLARLRGSLVATVLQNPARNVLPYATVLQNVRYAAAGKSGLRRPAEMLEQLGLAELGSRVAGQLSGGEQQRVAIAAAVCGGGRLLLADEPTSQLDAAGRDEIVDLLHRVRDEFGVTVVVVTHDPHIARHSGRTVTIRDGRVGAEGRHGRDFAVVGRDGSVQLPPEVRDQFPPGSMLEVTHDLDTITLRRRQDGPLDGAR